MHPGDKDEGREGGGQRWWHYYAAVKNMRSLNNSYYTQGQEGRLYWMGEHKPNGYWKVRGTGLTLSLTFCLLHPQNYDYFKESNPGKTHSDNDIMKIQFGHFATWCQSHFALQPGRDEEITAAFVSKWEPLSFDWTHSPFTHWRRARNWKGVFHH